MLEQKFETLVRNNFTRIYRYLLVSSLNPEFAKTQTQNTLLELYKHKFQPGENDKTVSLRLAFNLLRGKTELPQAQAIDPQGFRYQGIHDQTINIDYIKIIKEKFESLEPNAKEILELVAIEGLSFDEAAFVMNESAERIKIFYDNALDKLHIEVKQASKQIALNEVRLLLSKLSKFNFYLTNTNLADSVLEFVEESKIKMEKVIKVEPEGKAMVKAKPQDSRIKIIAIILFIIIVILILLNIFLT